jgi:hypothetical protein
VADLNAYTVLHPFDLPHDDEEHFAPCPDCDNPNPTLRGLVAAGPGLFKLCPTCKGTRGGGPSLGFEPSGHSVAHYAPGQTVHITAEKAEPFLADGTLAPSGADDIEKRLVVAAAERLGLTVS